MASTMTRPTRTTRTFVPASQPPKTKPILSRRPSLQVKTSSLRNPLPSSRPITAITKHRTPDKTPHTHRAPSFPHLLASRLAAGSPTVESPSIHDNIWRLQERLREMGPIYLYSDCMPADLFVSAVPLDALSPSTDSVSSTSAPSSSSTSSPLRRPRTRAAATVNIRARIYPSNGSPSKLVRRDFKLSEVRSTIPEARRLPSSPLVVAPSPVAETSLARKTLLELGISGPVVGPRSVVGSGPQSLLSPFAYRPPGVHGQGQNGDVPPMSPFPVDPLIGFERRKSVASLLVAATNTPIEPKTQSFSPEMASRGLPMHLEYARAYLPVLAALMLSGHVGEKDRIELSLPYPEAWEATVTYIYTGRPSINQKIRANARYLGGKI